MCCRAKAYHRDPELLKMMAMIGQFQEEVANTWSRIVGDSKVMLYLEPDGVRVSLQPSISTWRAHEDKREAAGVMFEIISRYAAKAGTAEVYQEGINVEECRLYTGEMRRPIWNPVMEAIDFDMVCPGWRFVFTSSGLVIPEDI